MKHQRALGAALTVVALTLAACGSDGDGDDAASTSGRRTIEVTMRDNSYAPAKVTVAKGEEVTFTFTNDGKVAHEALIGTEADQEDHEREMADRMDGQGMDGHDMGDMGHGTMSEALTVAPGKTASKTMTFDDRGTYLIGCHVPGHFAAGMKATVNVE